MLAENIHKNPEYTWFGVGPAQSGEQHFGMVWVVNPTPTPGDGVDQQERLSQASITDFADSRRFARPASSHQAGLFNVIFADGHGDTIRSDIDYTVYQRLMTPHGAKCKDPLNPAEPPGAVIDGFRKLAQITESDYQ
jgi:hypothetical protein